MSDAHILMLFGLVYFAVGVNAALEPKKLAKIVDNLESNPALTYVSGVFTAVIGYAIVATHGVWTPQWSVVVTILGWVALVKGLAMIAVPKWMLSVSGRFVDNKAFRSVASPLMFLLAAGSFALAWYLSK